VDGSNGKRWLAGRLAVAVLLAAGLSLPTAAQSRAASQAGSSGKTFGVSSAPITMEVFSDFECPACRQLYLEAERPLLDDYVPAGKVYLIYRDFPLPVHKYSREASRYATAAARIGKFEKVMAALFDKQAVWTADGNVEKIVAAVLTPSEMKRVQQSVNSPQVDTAIDRDVALGNQVPVRQTPTAIITFRGQRYPVVGVVSYSVLKAFFDQLLGQ
jgi:protein-disulfide isomerase